MDRKAKYEKIIETLKGGGAVMVCTYTHATIFSAKHIECFKLTENGLYARYGRRWDCIDFAGLRFGHR
jgi:hypothetical protein